MAVEMRRRLMVTRSSRLVRTEITRVSVKEHPIAAFRVSDLSPANVERVLGPLWCVFVLSRRKQGFESPRERQ